MITRGAVLFSAALLAIEASAEQVRVLSGEHADFSRIVLVFKEPVAWKQSSASDGYKVDFDRGGLALDLSRVFDLIPRDRIEDLAFDERTSILAIKSSCQCELDIFEAGKNTLGLDVRSVDTVQPDLPHRSSAEAYFPFGTTAFGPRARERPDGTTPVAADQASTAPQPTSPASREQSIDHLETMLLANLGRAATQGLAIVEADFQIPESQPAGYDGLAALNPKHMRSETVMDQVGLMAAVSMSPSDQSSLCPSPDLVDVPNWFRTEDAAEVLSDARRGLDPHSDDPDQVLSLARAYIGLGFGAEAIATLREFSVENSMAFALAEIMDNGVASDQLALATGANCTGAFPLWSALAVQDISAVGNPDLDRIKLEFSRLPPHLRVHLGPVLARRLLDAGRKEAAIVIRDATERLQDSPNAALDFFNATSDLPNAPGADPDRSLQTIVASGSEQSAPALLELMERRLAAGTIDHDMAILAEGMAQENQDTESGTKLLEKAAVTRAFLGDFDAALDLFAEAQGKAAFDSGATLSEIVRHMLDSHSDVDLLLIFGSRESDIWASHLERPIKLAVARRLLELSLPQLAEPLLKEFKLSNDPAPRQLRAKMALQNREPALALSLIAGEQDPVSTRLRAEALAGLGQHAQAAALFEEASTPEAAGREAWLAADGSRISTYGSTAQKAFAALLLERAESGSVEYDDGLGDSGYNPLAAPESTGRNPNPIEITADPSPAASRQVASLSGSRVMVANSRKRREIISAILADR